MGIFFRQSLTGLSLACAFFWISSCTSQKEARKTGLVLSSADSARYLEDAHRIALRELTDLKTGTSEMEAEIPQDRVKYYFSCLLRCRTLWKSSDTIPDLDTIHTFSYPDMKRLRVILSENSPYKKSFSQASVITDNLYVNQLISKYGLSIKNYRESSIGPEIFFESTGFINTPELGYILAHLDGFRFAEPEGAIGDGNEIFASPSGKNGVILKFSVGEGDCAAGCINRKYWVFVCSDDGNTTYLGTETSGSGK